jgi:hypothetical protein
MSLKRGAIRLVTAPRHGHGGPFNLRVIELPPAIPFICGRGHIESASICDVEVAQGRQFVSPQIRLEVQSSLPLLSLKP